MSPSRVIVLPTCSICRDDSADLDISATTCGHVFHTKCIREWDTLQVSQGIATKCPICNYNMRTLSWITLQKLHSLTAREIPDQPLIDLTDTARVHLQETLDVLQGQIKADMAERVTKSFAELGIEDIKLQLNRWERDAELQARLVEVAKLEKTVDELSKNNQLLKDEKAKLYQQSVEDHKTIRDSQASLNRLELQHAELAMSNAHLKAQLQETVKAFDDLKLADSVYQRSLDAASKTFDSIRK
ncbi:hypothetical protein PtB15_16B86 [Puccinia triticina]|nr:hypothetical protein PtB15_16B86 [Puccinia triticina]